jgi:hypothetical protein
MRQDRRVIWQLEQIGCELRHPQFIGQQGGVQANCAARSPLHTGASLGDLGNGGSTTASIPQTRHQAALVALRTFRHHYPGATILAFLAVS